MSCSFRLRLIAGTMAWIVGAAVAGWAQEGVIDHTAGFAGQNDLTLNGASAKINGTNAVLTDGGGNEAATLFHTVQVPVGAFQTLFRFHQIPPATGSPADGMCFILQNDSATALGPSGGGLGYGPDTIATNPLPANAITNSICIKFDIYSNDGEGTNSTGLFVNGHAPTVVNGVAGQTLVNLAGTAITLGNGDDMTCFLSYNGTTLTETITDLKTNGTFTTTYTINIPSFTMGNSAWAGFGGGTGGLVSTQEVVSWAYGVGLAPTNLVATAGPNQSSLTWTAPTTGATSYVVLRSTTQGSGYAPIAQGVTGTSYLDTNAPGGTTVYYVVMATTAGGNSLYSNEASCTPILPVVTLNPTTGLTVNETGTMATFTLTPRLPVTGTFTVTVTSPTPGQATVSANGSLSTSSVQLNFSSQAAQTVTVSGVDDHIANDPTTVVLSVSITASTDGNYPTSSQLQSVTVSVLESDTPGLVFGAPSGLVVDGGPAVTFTVALNSIPVSSVNPVTGGTAVFNVVNSAPQVCTVTPTTVSFNNGNWNTPVPITITPMDDKGQNPTVFFSVAQILVTFVAQPSSTDPTYAALPASSMTLPFIDNYPKPPLATVWGSSGGCGLVGLELLVPLGIAWRRRRRRPTA